MWGVIDGSEVNRKKDHLALSMLRIFRIKESKVCIQLSLSVHQESRDDIRQNPLTNWRKTTFLNGMINVHNRGPKHLGQKEESEQVY